MQKILLTRRLQPIAKEILSKYFLVDEYPIDDVMPAHELKKAIEAYDGILSTIPDRLSEEVLANAKKLKVISNYAAGLDNIAVSFAKSKGIAVYNLPDTVTESTADLTLALLLSFIRKIPDSAQYVKQGSWKGWEPNLFLGEELSGKTFAIIGYGRIGKAVAQRALGFGLKVIVFHRSLVEDKRVRQVTWDQLLQEADYISLHLPLTPETQGLINLQTMQKMHKKPVLINMARGSIINTDDLVIALEKGYVRGAALDVTAPEPISSSHPLCMMENCLIIPHLGSATIECRTKMAKEAAENILKYFQIIGSSS